ncbi:hypothetical protein DID88_000602 [Monilinia fructigena]|uniref:Uncharacterized protein n=1 Tax=Monilinia fructigena TaxID=38457 RepID=A0A395IIG7_9HELO|nr:hypothetical protein DID88_000602 [Monilinia fructigena]
MTADSLSTGVPTLTPVLAQIVRWLKWESWIDFYDTEEASLADATYDTGLLALVGRQDVSVLLTLGRSSRNFQPSLLPPSHESNLDVHAICASTTEIETPGILMDPLK